MGLKLEEIDDDRKGLLSKIIKTIAKDQATGKVHREVQGLWRIYGCTRNRNNTTEALANSFHPAVANYTNHSCGTDDSDGRQWAVVPIRNAKHTADTRSEVSFPTTTHATVCAGNGDNDMVSFCTQV